MRAERQAVREGIRETRVQGCEEKTDRETGKECKRERRVAGGLYSAYMATAGDNIGHRW